MKHHITITGLCASLIGLVMIILIFGKLGLIWSATIGIDHQAASVIDAASVSIIPPDLTLIATSSPESEIVSSTTIMIGGDVMFDRAIRKIGQSSGYDGFFTEVAPLFKSVDIAVVNLEGPITASTSKTLLPNGKLTDNLNFTFAPETAAVLARAGITLVSLANNHTDNYGRSGFLETKKWLSIAGVRYFGDPWNGSTTESVITKNGIPVAFVGYHAYQKGFDRVLAAVKRLKAEGDFVIVMPHWGTEYDPHPTPDIQDKARELVAAGAGAVIGSHPHVIEDHISIGPVPVFFSLGNLLFDQYSSPETMKGDIVELRLVKDFVGSVKLDNIKIHETSIASRKMIEVSP